MFSAPKLNTRTIFCVRSIIVFLRLVSARGSSLKFCPIFMTKLLQVGWVLLMSLSLDFDWTILLKAPQCCFNIVFRVSILLDLRPSLRTL